MSTLELLKARPIAATNLRQHLFEILKQKKPYLVTAAGRHGKKQARMFLIPYEDVVEMLEILEESKDGILAKRIKQAREEYRNGGGVLFEE